MKCKCLSLLVCEIYKPKDECEVHTSYVHPFSFSISTSLSSTLIRIAFVASIILLVATGANYNWGWGNSYSKYAISVSSISLSISAICLLMHKFACSMYEKVGKNLCLLNFTWSFVGACFLTFKGPFEAVSTPFFVLSISHCPP